MNETSDKQAAEEAPPTNGSRQDDIPTHSNRAEVAIRQERIGQDSPVRAAIRGANHANQIIASTTEATPSSNATEQNIGIERVHLQCGD